MSSLWITLVPFAGFFVWLFLFGFRQRRACPDCRQPLSFLQSPFTKTRRQWWEGGYLCPNCGCEADMAGRKVVPGTAPSRRSIVTGIGLLMLATAPAIILVAILLQP